MRVILLGMAFSLLAICLRAQENVSGLVVEENNKGAFSPIPFANIHWMNTSIGTITDSTGAFQIPYNGQHQRLVISYIGYKTDTISVEQPQNLTIILKSQINLDEVKVVHQEPGTKIDYMNARQVSEISQKELFKAACCNLSESFETNPSVDVSFTDAVTGNKQIELLGLSGPYTQITRELLPGVSGLNTIAGLSLLPGPWIQEMQLSKGTGSVTSGYEGIAGQINIGLKKPFGEEAVNLDTYANGSGRYEGNAMVSANITPHIGTTVLAHKSARTQKNDRNNDGFLDSPLSNTNGILNSYKYHTDKGWEGMLGIQYFDSKSTAGQTNFAKWEQGEFRLQNPFYGVIMNNQSLSVYTKNGYVFPGLKYKSMGLQLQYDYVNQSNLLGNHIYLGKQNSFYGNFIYQSIIGTSDHVFKTGASFRNDNYQEQFDLQTYNRNEIVPGAFFEYTHKGEKSTAILGMRADYHNLFGMLYSPRLHYRYPVNDKNIVRLSAGIAHRSPQVLIENQGYYLSGRQVKLPYSSANFSDNLTQETATSVGISYTKYFKLNYNSGTLIVDYFHTRFSNALIRDVYASGRELNVYNLQGNYFANSLLAELSYEWFTGFTSKFAFRYYDVQADYISGMQNVPMVAKTRGFVNLAYETYSKWVLDATASFVGQKPLPFTGNSGIETADISYSPNYTLVNAQVTKKFGDRFDVYLGGENLLNYRQDNPILNPDNPNSDTFDASVVWGPIFGRMFYLGARWRLKVKEKR